jgi:hypothetical protein
MISVAHGSIPGSNGLVGVTYFWGCLLWLGGRALKSSLTTPHCCHAEGNLVLSSPFTSCKWLSHGDWMSISDDSISRGELRNLSCDLGDERARVGFTTDISVTVLEEL